MGIGPLELSGTISRVQDFAIIKHQEDNKGAQAQVNISAVVQQEGDDKAVTVTMSGMVDNEGKKHDAKEEGKNKYFKSTDSDNKKNTPKEGRVIMKATSSGFDIRI